jgi:hypothetical protein
MTSKKEMSEAAREARRTYMREWRRKNKDKTQEHTRRYWEKKAQDAQDEGGCA